jgi:hypothetical protein
VKDALLYLVMISSDPSSVIKRVGFNVFKAEGILDESYTAVNKETIEDLIASLRKYTGISSYFIHPNYQFSYFGCSGFVADIDTGTLYTPDLYTTHLYRVVFCTEIYVGDETKFRENLMSKKSVVRAMIPDMPAVSMTHESVVEEGWSPALGQYGGMLCIGYTRESDTNTNTNSNRWFLYGKCGIHDTYVNSLIDRDYQITMANMAPNDNLNQMKGTVTTKEEFTVGGIKDKAIELAKENCRRLVRVFATALGVTVTEGNHPVTHVGEDDEPSYYEIPPMKSSSSRSSAYLKEAMNLWPKDATIYPYSVLDLHASHKLNGYEIGAVLLTIYLDHLNKNNVGVFESDMEQARLHFSPFVHSYARLDIENMYNSHEVVSGSRLRWYSNCTPINNITGVAVVMPIRVGLRVLNSPLFGEVDHTWVNNYGSSYPVVFPYKDGPKPQVSQDIIIFDSQGDTPKQLDGNFYGVDQLTEPHILKAYNDESNRISRGVLIEPVFVYLSPHTEKNNTLTFYGSHS